jgi:hypothetical protein
MGQLLKPPMLPQAAFHHPPWGLWHRLHPMAEIAIALSGGRSFYSCITLTAGLSEELYTWLEPQRTSYGFSYSSPWFLARLIHAPVARSPSLPCQCWLKSQFLARRSPPSSTTPAEGGGLSHHVPVCSLTS